VEIKAAETKQWGAQENLWPKFILKSAPLRATSSGGCLSIRRANRKLLKILDGQDFPDGRNCQTPGKIYVDGSGKHRAEVVVEIQAAPARPLHPHPLRPLPVRPRLFHQR
jgi:hypothetical protein